jgi:hypothetical protein
MQALQEEKEDGNEGQKRGAGAALSSKQQHHGLVGCGDHKVAPRSGSPGPLKAWHGSSGPESPQRQQQQQQTPSMEALIAKLAEGQPTLEDLAALEALL